MSFKPAIELASVSKQYRIYKKPSDRLAEILFGKKKCRLFTALHPMDLTIERGEFLGVIGRNGAGKSTLLGTLCGTLTPTTGRVSTQGIVTTLLELGGCFHPDFTGRENVYMYARTMGMFKQDITKRMDSIIGFADIGEFVDRPLRVYSSGMRMRLAFATTIHLESDILLLDEILAVGDAAFQRKCTQHMQDLISAGRKTFVLVSHSLDMVSTFCTRVIVLDQGRIVFDGEPKQATNFYRSLLSAGNKMRVRPTPPPAEGSLEFESRHGSGEATIESLTLTNGANTECSAIEPGQQLQLHARIRADRLIQRPLFFIRLKTKHGINVYSRLFTDQPPLIPENSAHVSFRLSAMVLAGDYFFTVSISEYGPDRQMQVLDARVDAVHMVVTGDHIHTQGIADLSASLEFLPESP